MALYKVKSKALQRYAYGLLVVDASTLIEARQKALLLGRIALLCEFCFISSDVILSGNKTEHDLKTLYLNVLRREKEVIDRSGLLCKIAQLKQDVLSIEHEKFGVFAFGSE